ncbi:ABC transporter permease [Asaccharospora irregularis]|uniref:Peptide/nickel transport system permease protein n=1 Tax=Asaccharospora irregularis DSM 2635 TaxID=1121321 RepID=A0A1M5NVZ0_9FIRM|nr:ABC transporter permease [Asaccharospora irregularis]SHG93746.1 peptide/nickel transport system permease protein [Asaccharospora irregularis DSM 2635]
MIKDLFSKLLQFILAIFILSFIVFFIARLSPGDPLASYYGEGVDRISTQERKIATDKLGLDKPIFTQYIKWVSNASKGEFGISFKYKQDVIEVIKGLYMNTVVLSGGAYILTFILALLLGLVCAFNEGKLIDRLICKLGIITNSVPSFWISLILILIFSINLKLLPTSGAYSIGKENSFIDRVLHLILPMTVIIISHLWYYAYLVRNKLIEEKKQEYVLLCKAKGLSDKQIMYKHCLRNIIPSYINLMAVSVPHIIGGTYIVEKVFSYPGLGTLCFESAKYHDYNMLLVLSLITGALVLFSSAIAQIISNNIDPRIKHES